MKWRKPTPGESALLAILLAPEFPGCAALRAQLEEARVRTLDDEGSLEIQVQDPRATVLAAIPVDAQAKDSDGVVVNAFLHVVDGLLAELEVVKSDGSALQRLPPASDWEVIVLG